MGNSQSKLDSPAQEEARLCQDCSDVAAIFSASRPTSSSFTVPKRRLASVVAEAGHCAFCRLLWRATWRNALPFQRGIIQDCFNVIGVKATVDSNQPVDEPVETESSTGSFWERWQPVYACVVRANNEPAPCLEYKIALIPNGTTVCVNIHQVIADVDIDTVEQGHFIDPNCFNSSLCKAWIRNCQEHHQNACTQQWGLPVERPSLLWVIDVEEQCIAPLPSGKEYITLSYVWGRRLPPDARLAKSFVEFRDRLSQKGSLSEYFRKCDVTYRDSIRFVASIGERYLWIDFICIPPDPATRVEQIMNMDKIYACSLFTIVAADGENSSSGLPGISRRTMSQKEHYWQIKEKVTDSLSLASTTPLPVFVNKPWNSRGWTFQEKLLSSRLLVFSSGQVFWQCSKSVFFEDCSLERKFGRCEGLDRPLRMLNECDKSSLQMPSPRRSEYLAYITVVSEYSQRRLTSASDVLDAFQGLSRVFQNCWQTKMLQGLPEVLLERALLWHRRITAIPRRSTLDKALILQHRLTGRSLQTMELDQQPDRRLPTHSKKKKGFFILDPFERRIIKDRPFPSWSWIGWVGAVVYCDPDLPVRPLIKWWICSEGVSRPLSGGGFSRTDLFTDQERSQNKSSSAASASLGVDASQSAIDSSLVPSLRDDQLFTMGNCVPIRVFELEQPALLSGSQRTMRDTLYYEIRKNHIKVGHVMLTIHESVDTTWDLLLLSETKLDETRKRSSTGFGHSASRISEYEAEIPLYNVMLIEWNDSARVRASRVGLGIMRKSDWPASEARWRPVILE